MWLRDVDTGTAYFPDSDGCFKLKDSGVKYYQDLIVEGPSATTPTYKASATGSQQLGTGGTHLPQLPPLFTPAKSSCAARGSSGSFALKITKATIAVASQGSSTYKTR